VTLLDRSRDAEFSSYVGARRSLRRGLVVERFYRGVYGIRYFPAGSLAGGGTGAGAGIGSPKLGGVADEDSPDDDGGGIGWGGGGV
jgi:hypothetical protein